MNIKDFSNKHGINEKLLKAVVAVESSGSGFNADGSIKLRIEAHLVLDKYPNLSTWFRVGNPRWTNQEFKFPSKSNRWRQIHDGNYFTEYTALLVASFQIQHEAFRFCSFGKFQLMGFHHQRLGFDTPISMYTFMNQSDNNDTEVGLRFFETSPSLLENLRNRDLVSFIKEYNGSGAVQTYLNRFNQEMARL